MPVAASEALPETADIETSSEDYAQRFSGPVGAWFLRVQRRATLKMLAPYPGAQVLDVGGGHGQTTAALVEHGYHVTVLGSDPVCKARIAGLVDQGLCRFEVGNAVDLPYRDREFDVVISYRLLPHVTQWPRFVAELCRVAGKVVIVDYPTARSINSIAPYLFRFKKRLEGNTREYTTFQDAELLSVFGRYGFRQAARYAEFFLPMVLHRALKQPAISAAMEGACRTLGLTGLFGSPVIVKLARKGGGRR